MKSLATYWRNDSSRLVPLFSLTAFIAIYSTLLCRKEKISPTAVLSVLAALFIYYVFHSAWLVGRRAADVASNDLLLNRWRRNLREGRSVTAALGILLLIQYPVFYICTLLIFLNACFVSSVEIGTPAGSGKQVVTSYFEALYLVAISATTIGFGDFTPHTPLGRLLIVLASLIGILALGVVSASCWHAINRTYTLFVSEASPPATAAPAMPVSAVRDQTTMSRTQLRTALLISISAFCILVIHHIWPAKVPLDKGTLALLAIAVVPWLTLFFKKLKIPGLAEGETFDRTQGATDKPLPPATSVLPTTAEPTEIPFDTKKLLATLWRYQRQNFGDDPIKRWTFRISEVTPTFPSFLRGLSDAVTRGWVAVSPESHQCMLTNEGITYVAAQPSIQAYEDIWSF